MAVRAGQAKAMFWVLRAPLLPMAVLDQLSETLDSPAALALSDDTLDQAVQADRQRVRQRMLQLIERPEVLEALFVASPSTVDSLHHWREAPTSERGQKIERTLAKYLTRMCSRSTPFGLFAACSMGQFGRHTALDLSAAPNQLIRRTRLDGDYLFRLCEELAKDPAIRAGLPHEPNSTLYRGGGRLRYAEAVVRNQVRYYELVAVEPTPYLEATLERARGGALPADLAQALVASDPEIEIADAETFIAELIDTQLLVPRLSPPVTGGDALAAIIGDLEPAPAAQPIVEVLRTVQSSLGELDRGAGQPLAGYRRIAESLEQLPAKVELKRLFQVDAARPGHLQLGARVHREIDRAVSLLERFDDGADPLADFRSAFLDRYEGREVPLTEVLDEELGIGMGRGNRGGREAPLLRGIPLRLGEPKTPGFSERHQWLLRLLHRCHRTGQWEVELTERDIEQLTAASPRPLPDAFAIMGSLEASDAAALDAGEFTAVIDGLHGPSGGNLLGRFCHLSSELTAAVEQHLASEEALAPEPVFAEVAHLPQGRIGNVLLRPVLRDYEISFLARPAVAPDRQIPVQDLLVSVQGGQVMLRSARLGRQVIPRLTTAHNFVRGDNLALYRFLCSMQGQATSDSRFSWGPLDSSPRLPRVRVGRLVLSRASWRLRSEDLEAVVKADGVRRYRAAQALRAEHDLPRHVAVKDGDNVLYVDLDNPLAVDVFAHQVRRARQVVLTERWSADRMPVRGDDDIFAHEFVVPYVRTEPSASAVQTTARATEAVGGEDRTLLPGSPWLYAKLYCGEGAADWILSESLIPFVQACREAGLIDGWFFLRYGDPSWHVRVRFHGEPEVLVGRVLPGLRQAIEPAFADGRLWKMEIDSYVRELERYGGVEAMPHCESLFCADSDAVGELLEHLWGEDAREARWRVALIGADRILDDFGFSDQQKLEQARQARAGYAAEMKVDAAVDKALGERFRPLRSELEALIAPGATGGEYGPAYQIYDQRSQASAAAIAQIRTLHEAGRLTRSPRSLADSLIHMHLNRLLRSAQRPQEMVIYDFLTRIYTSRAARARKPR